NGRCDTTANELLSSGFRLTWQSRESARNGTDRTSKLKYTCPDCGQNAWAKPDAKLACGECNPGVPLMGNGLSPQPNGQHRRSHKDLEEENRRLREENERLQQDTSKDQELLDFYDWELIIDSWYLGLKQLYDPDRGGTPEQMQVVYEAHKRLKQEV